MSNYTLLIYVNVITYPLPVQIQMLVVLFIVSIGGLRLSAKITTLSIFHGKNIWQLTTIFKASF